MIAAVDINGVPGTGSGLGGDLGKVEAAGGTDRHEAGAGIGAVDAVQGTGDRLAGGGIDALDVAAIQAGSRRALQRQVVAILVVDLVLDVVFVHHHQGALLPGDAADDGAALLVTTLFGGRADTALEFQPFIVLFQDDVDDTADGIGTVQSRAAVQVHFYPLHRRHGDGVEVDGAATHGRRTGDPLAVEQHQGAL